MFFNIGFLLFMFLLGTYLFSWVYTAEPAKCEPAALTHCVAMYKVLPLMFQLIL
jgi:hypothetical protein